MRKHIFHLLNVLIFLPEAYGLGFHFLRSRIVHSHQVLFGEMLKNHIRVDLLSDNPVLYVNQRLLLSL